MSAPPRTERIPVRIGPEKASTSFFRRNLYVFALALAVVMLVINLVMQPNFGPVRQLASFAPIALAAIATAIPVFGGGMDLSVSAQMVLTSILFIGYLTPAGLGGTIAIPILLILGAIIGTINGLIVVKLRLQPIVATLAVMFVIMGINLKLAPTPFVLPGGWVIDLAASVWVIPGGLITIGIVLLIWYGVTRTAFGPNLFAIGGNDVSAYSAGAKVNITRVLSYTLGGLIAAIGGLALTALISSADASASMAYTLPAIAAVALGGIAITGGRGSIIGAVCGAAVIYLTQNLLSVFQVPSVWLNLVFGLLLLFAVLMSALLSAPKKRVM